MSNKSAEIIANRYLVERCLGEGGMGMVFLARDRLLQNTLVAVKLLHRNLTSNPELISRFLREMQTLRQINHANVVRIFDTGEYEGEYFYTMEYLQGSSLASLVDDPPPDELIPWDRLRGMFIQILRGLHAVHASEIVHRDIKPDNMILIGDDVVKLADFGIARTSDSNLTETQAILGTPCYIPPEIWKGEGPTALTDIYALGVVFFEMLTRTVPFPGDNPAHVMKLHLMERATSVNEWRDDLPFWVDKAIQKMLEKEPGARPPSVEIILRLFENPPQKPVSKRQKTVPLGSGSSQPVVRAPKAEESSDSLSSSLKERLSEESSLGDPLRERLEGLASGSTSNVSSGVHSSGVRSSGVRSSGVRSNGTNSSGIHSSGTHQRGTGSPAASSSGNRTMIMPPDSSASRSPAVRLELESPGKNRGGSARQRLRHITKRRLRKTSKLSKRSVGACGAIVALLGMTAYPRTADWLELQISRVSPAKKAPASSELNSIERFVGAYYRDRDSQEKLTGDYEVFQRELSVEVSDADNTLKDHPLPAGSDFLLSGRAVQMESKQEMIKPERKPAGKGAKK